MKFLSRIGGLIIAPKDTMRAIVHERRELIEALAVVLFFSFTQWMAFALALRHLITYLAEWRSILPLAYAWPPRLTSSIVIALGVTVDFLLWILLSVGSYIAARAFEGSGDLEITLLVLGYAYVSKTFAIVPLMFSPLMPLASLVASLVGCLVGLVWFIYVSSLGMSEAHGLSLEKAVFAIVLPPLVVIGVLAILSLVMLPIRIFMRWPI
ncbi:MAG: hypothetical protein DRN15_07540 [Thermoprotei archaeon]|nr:MAG: hypothetical protein DRN15_07540 [Thermoprotei archaeon]